MRNWILALALVVLASQHLPGIVVVEGADPDTNPSCGHWAEMGECEKNPGYMMQNCATSCEEIEKQALADSKELEGIESFFDLSAYDIHGTLVPFSKFAGQVLIVVNVASYCGYTDDHYKQLVQLSSQVKHTGKINIMAFPCNQFGGQEPDSNEEIHEFALGYGADFQMMSKINVNGAQASPVYKYLKKVAGPTSIGWNFATYYLVAPDGTVESHSGVEPLELKDVALGKLTSDEL